jgi:hypothetical protein
VLDILAATTPMLRLKISLLWLSLIAFAIIELALLCAYHYSDNHWQNTIVFGASIVAGAFALFSYMKKTLKRRGGQQLYALLKDGTIQRCGHTVM